MIGVLEALEARSSCRKFRRGGLAPKALSMLQWAFTRAPYGSGGPRRELTVISEEDKKVDLQKACYDQLYVGSCSSVFVICGKDMEGGPWDQAIVDRPGPGAMKSGHCKYVFDVAAATMCMDLMATSMGLGTCWIGHFDPKEVQRIAGTSSRPVILLLVGHPE